MKSIETRADFALSPAPFTIDSLIAGVAEFYELGYIDEEESEPTRIWWWQPRIIVIAMSIILLLVRRKRKP